MLRFQTLDHLKPAFSASEPLAGLVGQTAALFNPLVNVLRRGVLAWDFLHNDDTLVPVLAPAWARPKPLIYGLMRVMAGLTDQISRLLPCSSFVGPQE